MFDCCVHNLVRSGESSTVNRVWQDLGVFPALPTVAYKEFVQVEDDQHRLTFYTDLATLQRHMKEPAPADARVIEELIRVLVDVPGWDARR